VKSPHILRKQRGAITIVKNGIDLGGNKMKRHSILTFALITGLILAALVIFLGSPASAGNDQEEDWPYDTNDQPRYMELHLKTYTATDTLVHTIEPEDEQNYKSTDVDRRNQYTGGGGNWHEFSRWESEPLLKNITATREDEPGDEDYFSRMVIYAMSEADDGTTDQVYIRVTVQFGGGAQIQDVDGPSALNNDQYTKFHFDLLFTDQTIDYDDRVTVIVEGMSEEEYDPLNEDQDETITMSYGDLGHDGSFNFEADTISVSVETDVNEEIQIKEVNGIAYANVSFVHAFGKKVIDQDRNYYIRLYGPANETAPAATDWDNTISWNDTFQYVAKEHDMVDNSVPVVWQIQGDKENPGVRAQYAPDERTYFIYFKGWDVYHRNNDTPAELNATFKVPKFPGAKERIELEWATDDIYFYNENGRRFDPTDDDLRGIAVEDKMFINATYKLGGGSNPDHIYNNLPIHVSVLKPDGVTEPINQTYEEMNVPGGSYKGFQTTNSWTPDEVGEGYKINLTLNPDMTIPEYNYTNNYLVVDVNVYENRRPAAVITSPVETIEGEAITYPQTGVDIDFDATDSTDPDTPYRDLDFEWVIENLETEIKRDKDSFTIQLTPGTYKVTLTVSDGIRDDWREIFITVNSPPKPSTGSNGIAEPEDEAVFSPEETIRFTALYNDADTDVLYYTWRSDQVGVLGASDSEEHFIEVDGDDLALGENIITVTVEDKHGGQHVSEILVFINNLPRVIVVSPEDGMSYGSGEELSFDASLSTDTEDGSGNMLSYVWYYDDGDGYEQFGYTSVVDRPFRTTGEYKIKVEVYDSSDGMNFEEFTIYINSKPIAKIGDVKGDGKELTFDGSDSYDPDGAGIDRYIWDFDTSYDSDDDGDPANDKDGEGRVTIYKFNSTGTYNISLTVEDGDGVRSEPVFMDLKVEDEDDDGALPSSIIVVSIAAAALVMAFRRKR